MHLSPRVYNWAAWNENKDLRAQDAGARCPISGILVHLVGELPIWISLLVEARSTVYVTGGWVRGVE